MALSAGTAYVDILPRTATGFQGALSGALSNPLKKAGLVAGGVAVAGVAAGVAGAVVFEFLETGQKAALGGVTDLSTAVDGISSVVNAYGDDVINASEASDLMFTAVRLGKTNFEELSSSLFNVIPTASALGVEFGDVTAGLAAMTAQGTPTKVATTQMRQLFVELSKSGGEAATTFTELAGKPFQEFIAGGGSVADALAIMQDGAAEAGVGVQDLFGSVEAGQAALALSGSDKFNEALAEMGQSAGATDAAYEQMDQGLSRSWDKIKATFAVALTDIGGRLAPFVQKFADFFADRLPGIIDGFVTFLEPIIDIVGGVFTAIGDLFSGVSDNASEAQGILQPIIEHIVGVFTFLRDVVSDVITTLRGVFEENSDKIRGALQTLGEIFRQIFTIAQTIFGALRDFWDQWGDEIMVIFGFVFDNVINVLSGAFTIIKGIFDVVLGILTGDWRQAWNGIKSIFEGVWNIIKGIFENIAEFLINLWHSLFGNGIIVDIIAGGIERITTFFRELPGKIIGFLSSLPGKMIQLGADLVAGLIKGLGNIVSSVGNKIKSGISGAIDGVKGFFGIGSPSKVFADEIGGPLLEGILMPFGSKGQRVAADTIGNTIAAGAQIGATAAARGIAGAAPAATARIGPRGVTPVDGAAAAEGMTFEDGAIRIINPTPEPASVTLPRELRRTQYQNSRG